MYENNSWVSKNNSETIFVFIHGILSSSDTCWRNDAAGTYWPELVASDPELHHPSVFVGGYPADIAAGRFDIDDAAEFVMLHLRSVQDSVTPLSKSKIVFVCHSQGGIVLRQMLIAFADEFRDRKIGAVLCASPSWGSFWATLAALVTRPLGFRQGYELRWGDPTLIRLDRQFVRLISKRSLHLEGMCLIETQGLLPFLPTIVSEPAATRYFDWHRIAKSTHGEVVKPASVRDPSHMWLKNFVNAAKLISVKPSAYKGQSISLNAPPVCFAEDLAPPGADFSEAVNQEFVGRERLREEISNLFARLASGTTGVYWVHGFGGMGKSFFLRRAFLDVPDGLLKCLVDWDDSTDRYRLPLHDRPRTVVDLCDAIAHAFCTATSREQFKDYWAASGAVRGSEANRARLERNFDAAAERLTAMLLLQNPDAFPEFIKPTVTDRFDTDEEARRAKELETLLSLVSDESTVQAALQRIHVLRRHELGFFDFAAWEAMTVRWIRAIAPDASPELFDPSEYLIGHLSAALRAALKNRGCVLFSDTQELLSDRLSWNLLRLLTSAANHGARLLTIVASRYEPDFRLPHPAFAGWHETLKGRLKTEHFAGNVRFTRSDVMQMLSRCSRPAPPIDNLPDRILAVTLGIPMAVGMIVNLHNDGDEILTDIFSFDPVDKTEGTKSITRRIIGEVSRRFLLHIEVRRRDEEALKDVIFLTISGGLWVEELQRLWWGGDQRRSERLLQLAKQVDFIDGGSLHPEPARYFRRLWREQPHPLLNSVVSRAAELMRSALIAATSRQELYRWLTTFYKIALWSNESQALTFLLQSVILRLADPELPIWSGEDEDEADRTGSRTEPTILQLASLPDAESVGRHPHLLSFLEAANTNGWPQPVRASWQLVLGYSCAANVADSGSDGKSHKAMSQAIGHLDRSLELFENDIPDREAVFEKYAEMAVAFSINQNEVDFAKKALESLQKWRGEPQSPEAWINYGKLLHNVHSYEASTAAYRKAVEAYEQSNWPLEQWQASNPKLYIAHNLHHEGRRQDEIETLESIGEGYAYDTATRRLGKVIFEAPQDVNRCRKFVRRVLKSEPPDALTLVRCAIFMVKTLNRRSSALIMLRRAQIIGQDLGASDKNELLFWLMVAESFVGDKERAKVLEVELKNNNLNAEVLNGFAWIAYQQSAVLQFGLDSIEEALRIAPNTAEFVNTKLALLCRTDRWIEVPDALAWWLRLIGPGGLRGRWPEYREIFALIQRSPTADQCALILNKANDQDCHILAEKIRGKEGLTDTFPIPKV